MKHVTYRGVANKSRDDSTLLHCVPNIALELDFSWHSLVTDPRDIVGSFHRHGSHLSYNIESMNSITENASAETYKISI